MHSSRHSSVFAKVRSARRMSVHGALASLCSAALIAGCGQTAAPSVDAPRPLSEGDIAIGERQLAEAARVARGFAAAYALNAYVASPPPLPGATPTVNRVLRVAAARVPRARRRLRPKALSLALFPRGVTQVDASVRIGDGRSPDFTVGFSVRLLSGRWRVASVSPPG